MLHTKAHNIIARLPSIMRNLHTIIGKRPNITKLAITKRRAITLIWRMATIFTLPTIQKKLESCTPRNTAISRS